MNILRNLDRLSCKKATLLSVKKQEGRISLLERIQLSYHNRLCGVCDIWDKQIAFIDEMLKNNYNHKSIEKQVLTKAEKENIKSSLKG